jgi:rRNA maturation endonuclease Nob1
MSTQQGKNIEKIFCESCDSEFKLIYVNDEVYGFHKFCPFCGSELPFEDEPEEEEEPEE